ncbi:2-polyprenyl-6-methoxyphenol hydroxylase [Sinosporangium album]|uniref:2-polyprenyl-6-methoxyphenol hydroxylase n=1 Tax=Sinosporangium album TaxID=504805 RepID=A0A1G7ZHS9_9ACTN|nr:FAD-dependent monooxygenase [Sinosporangium album]SDH08189.1 2-polyprenyl-6-methoxyphenol hydroxylase [Sinosporangium album]
MTEEFDTDVLIVGAGPTGLTLACDIARRGIDHRVVERDPAPNRATRAKTIQPRSLEVLDDLGAVDHVLQRGVAYLDMRFHEADGAIVDRPSISVRANDSYHTPYPDPLWIGQFEIEHALRHRHGELGGKVEFGTEVVGIEQDDAGVTVTLLTQEGEQTVRARFVVGADGGKSTTRKLIGLPLVGETYGWQRWYLGDVTVPDLDRAYMHIWPSERGFLGLTPLGDELWQFQSPILPDDEPETPSPAFYQRLFDERAGAAKVVLTSASWLSVYQIQARMAQEYRKGRVLLAGDAAHVHSAAGGQGMNTGIQDAYNLGWKLDSVLSGAYMSLLDTYGTERVPVARTVLEMSSDKMNKALEQAGSGSEQGLGPALKNIGEGSLNSGLGIRYRDSPMVYHRGEETVSGPVAGDRAPNAGGLEGAGFSGDLFDLLRGPHWSLVAYDHTDPVIFDNAKPTHMHVHRIGSTPDSKIFDAKGEFKRIYQPYPGEIILIRTDGHIIARASAGQEMDIINHLAPFRSIGNQVRPY